MYSLLFTNTEHAGRVLSHPLAPLLPARIVAALEEIAVSGAPLTPAQLQILKEAAIAIMAGEVLHSRRTVA